jgi:putative ABC transport system permease protein
VNLLIGAATVGLILAFLSLGIFISFRVLRSLDLTTDGSFTTGAVVGGAALAGGTSPWAAALAGALAGTACGVLTGSIQTRLRVDVILAGILVTTALYSIHIWVMGSGNLSLAGHPTVFDQAGGAGGWRDARILLLLFALVSVFGHGLTVLAGTDLGLALRAAGSSPRMAKAVAIDTNLATTLGLALANGSIAFSGALFAQYQGFANVQMGVGMIVTALASLILGEALFPQRSIRQRIVAALLGAVVFRLLVAAALRAGMDPNALKLVTAGFVLGALVVPRIVRRLVPAGGTP